jgi:hypothetical protein
MVDDGNLTRSSPTIQIISKKIDAEKLDDIDYIRKVRRSIKRGLHENADIIMIELVPKTPIKEKWILKSWLHFQREFTDLLIAPKNTVQMGEAEIKEMTNRLKATMIMKLA